MYAALGKIVENHPAHPTSNANLEHITITCVYVEMEVEVVQGQMRTLLLDFDYNTLAPPFAVQVEDKIKNEGLQKKLRIKYKYYLPERILIRSSSCHIYNRKTELIL